MGYFLESEHLLKELTLEGGGCTSRKEGTQLNHGIAKNAELCILSDLESTL